SDPRIEAQPVAGTLSSAAMQRQVKKKNLHKSLNY
ncbi:hypothetical protein Tco_0224918, partial [Tanacetum coccineum]